MRGFQAREYIKAIYAGNIQIENDEIRCVLTRHFHGRLTIVRFKYFPGTEQLQQMRPDYQTKCRMIVHDQY